MQWSLNKAHNDINLDWDGRSKQKEKPPKQGFKKRSNGISRKTKTVPSSHNRRKAKPVQQRRQQRLACTVCDRTYARKADFKKHSATVHGTENYSATVHSVTQNVDDSAMLVVGDEQQPLNDTNADREEFLSFVTQKLADDGNGAKRPGATVHSVTLDVGAPTTMVVADEQQPLIDINADKEEPLTFVNRRLHGEDDDDDVGDVGDAGDGCADDIASGTVCPICLAQIGLFILVRYCKAG